MSLIFRSAGALCALWLASGSSYRLVRYFANVPQSPTVGRITPEEPEQPLGCNRVDGREQRWEIKRASPEETKTP